MELLTAADADDFRVFRGVPDGGPGRLSLLCIVILKPPFDRLTMTKGTIAE